MANIKIVEPNSNHYEAFVEASKQMQTYLNDDSINDDVGKRESKSFIFAEKEMTELTQADFNSNIVDFYANRRLDEENRPISPRDPSRKIPPEYFYFIMDDDKIIGSVNARPQPKDEFDIKNGLKSYDKWDNLSPSGVRITTSTILLNEYRGIGIAGDVKKQFFDKLRNEGIEEVAATVEIDNKRSNNAQYKLINSYGGKSYDTECKHPDQEEALHYNRYVVNTDTSGKSKNLYSENNSEAEATDNHEPSEKIAHLRKKLNKSDTKAPYKPTQNLSEIDFNTLKMYHDKKQAERVSD